MNDDRVCAHCSHTDNDHIEGVRVDRCLGDNGECDCTYWRPLSAGSEVIA